MKTQITTIARFSSELLLGLIFWPCISSAHTLTCDYKYQSMDLATVQLTYLSDGSLQSFAEISMQGQKHTESVTKSDIASGELEHLWLSKEKPDNAVELIVFLQPQTQGNSKMINHNVPFAQEVWGTCLSADQ